MTKHTAGKYGRTIGQRERKAGWPSPATAWCYLCSDTHAWADSCAAIGSHPAFTARRDVLGAARRVA